MIIFVYVCVYLSKICRDRFDSTKSAKWIIYWRAIKSLFINSFHATGLFLYPLKATENLWFSDVFRGYREGLVVWNGLTNWQSESKHVEMHIRERNGNFVKYPACHENIRNLSSTKRYQNGNPKMLHSRWPNSCMFDWYVQSY